MTVGLSPGGHLPRLTISHSRTPKDHLKEKQTVGTSAGVPAGPAPQPGHGLVAPIAVLG